MKDLDYFLPTLFSIFLMGLLSSLHCVSMCGPFIGALNSCVNNQKNQLNLLYHLGRFISYTFVGTVLATFGRLINQKIQVNKIQNISAMISLVLLIFYLIQLINSDAIKMNQIGKNNWWSRQVQSLFSDFKLKNAFYFGIFTGFLPCGVLIPIYTLCLSYGNHIEQSVLIIISFFLGTLPLLYILGVGYGKMASFLSIKWIKKVNIILIVLTISLTFIRMLSTQIIIPLHEHQVVPNGYSPKTDVHSHHGH